MTKLEEIARAIQAELRQQDVIFEPEDDPTVLMMSTGTWADLTAVVRAAVEAMREPTKAMTEYAYKTMEIDSPDESYRHMIDAILNEKP